MYGKQYSEEKQSLIPHFKNVTRVWEVMKDHKSKYREGFNQEFFLRHPTYVSLFSLSSKQVSTDKEEASTSFLANPVLVKHAMAVMNFLEAVIEFVNGNEDSKPVLYALGKTHKERNITEKMFIEMKEALLNVLRNDMGKEMLKSWEVTLEFIFINYVFKGMNMFVTDSNKN